MFASVLLWLISVCAVATACTVPPCFSFPGSAGWRSKIGNETCCLFCSAGNRCDGRVMVPCNVSAGEYQPATAQNACLIAPGCSVGTWKSQPGTPTSAPVCSAPSTCDTLSQIEIAAPTLTSDRVCACISGWVGTTQCHRCSTLLTGCATCTQQLSQVSCTKCADGYTLTDTTLSNATCVPCTVPRCSSCRQANVCSACIDSLLLPGGVCGCTDPRCETCVSECTKCKHPYAFDTTGRCGLCIATHSLVDGECVLMTTTTKKPTSSTTTTTESTDARTSLPASVASNKGATGLPIYITAAISAAAALACVVAAVMMYRYILQRRVTALAVQQATEASASAVTQPSPQLPVNAFTEPDQAELRYLLPINNPVYASIDDPLYDIATTDYLNVESGVD